jgi:predicted PurR-regulated permease PerM
MKELIKVYQRKLIFWYFSLIFFFLSLIFLFSQVIKIFDNSQKLSTLLENKNNLISQVENLNLWILKINPERLIEPQTIPVNIAFEINSLSSAFSNLSSLYSENGSLFRIKEATISTCEKSENETLNSTCFYTIRLSGEKIKYAF